MMIRRAEWVSGYSYYSYIFDGVGWGVVEEDVTCLESYVCIDSWFLADRVPR